MQRRRRSGKGPFSWGLLLLGFLIGSAFVAGLLIYLDWFKPTPRVDRPGPQATVTPPPAKPPAPPAVPRPAPVVHAGPKLAIVIDDMGQDLKKLDALLKLGADITVAVLPNLAHSVETADRAHSKGLDVLVHMPMEPRDKEAHDPGDGVVLTTMSAMEISGLMERGIKGVPHAIGLNNHMGSRFTEDEAGMRAALGVVKSRKMFFLDSRTSPDSVGARLAREMGFKSAGRDVFLDNERDVEYIKARIKEASKIAVKKGGAIAIGHPYTETIEALRQAMPELSSNGVKVVRVSDLVR
ncbi:MAG: divergent polysaccharide deacetylase family protein [Deltaproteobacteria bacterium]|nr:divergent polysaccharide deacetylase family protein [Deltaproteobacteria bacterium]